VDMNSLNLAEVILETKKLAKERGVEILGSELIGLIPAKALTDAAIGFGLSTDEQGMQLAIESLGLSYHSKFELKERILENYF
jgi:glutamate formiminotransferase/formiminotetrahydrofolate cyclodeaminase